MLIEREALQRELSQKIEKLYEDAVIDNLLSRDAYKAQKARLAEQCDKLIIFWNFFVDAYWTASDLPAAPLKAGSSSRNFNRTISGENWRSNWGRSGKKEKPTNGANPLVDWSFWRSGRDSNPRGIAPKLISSQPRYDHFDTGKALQILEFWMICDFLCGVLSFCEWARHWKYSMQRYRSGHNRADSKSCEFKTGLNENFTWKYRNFEAPEFSHSGASALRNQFSEKSWFCKALEVSFRRKILVVLSISSLLFPGLVLGLMLRKLHESLFLVAISGIGPQIYWMPFKRSPQ